MVRLLHIADIHLGMENYGRTDPATGHSSRLGDFLKTLDEALDWALANDVHLVLIAGDIYKNRDPSPTVQRAFAGRIRRLADAHLPVFLLVGNHDLPNAAVRAHTVDIFRTLGVPGVYVGDRIARTIVPTAAGPVQIVSVPWVTPSILLSKDELRSLPMEEIGRQLIDRIETLLDQRAAELDPSLPAVCTAHAVVAGATYGSERSVMLGQDLRLSKADLARPEFDYVAMGHIHSHQFVPGRSANDPPIAYPGSLERIDFGEEKEQKGFIVVDIADRDPLTGRRAVQAVFHPVQARRFLTVHIDAGGPDAQERVLHELAERADEIRDAIVRVVIKTTPEHEARLRDDEIRKALAPAAYLAGISREVARPVRLRLSGQAVEQMTPRRALELYLDSKNTPAEHAAQLLSYADQLMNDPD